MKILLIAGGWSSERDVSLRGAESVSATLRGLGHAVDLFDLLEGFDRLLVTAGQYDFAFINLHGAPGEDGLVQAMLERAGCPYQGAGPAGSFLALNKAAAKQVFRQAGLPTADWEFLPGPPASDWQPRLPYPLFVKSNTGGSSLHLGRAQNRAGLDALLSDIFAAGQEALLEPELRGREVTCGVLGEEPLPPLLIEPVAGDFFDYESKYATGGAREICPAPIGEALTARVQTLALQAHRALGLYGYSRTDFILGADDSLTLLEVNTLPGMTGTSLVPQEAAAAGLDFGQLLERLIQLGLQRHQRKRPG
ncbi:MAG: D-alanine--D-alanine ligase [Desulfovibrio sp.]|nr:D-alanine--D-alanine ligase [Desulfovibrio sp.]